MNIRSINSAIATDGSTVERTKPGRGEHGQANHVHASTDSFQGDFKSLLNAVQSGDVTSAQSALDSLKGEVNGTSATYSPTSTAPTSTSSTASAVGADLKAMFDAVQAGDVEGAQAALKLFVSDARADGPNRAPAKANYGNSGLKISQALHRHHHRLGLESIIASLFSSANANVPPADSTTPATDSPPVDSSAPPTDSTTTPADSTTTPASDTPATDDATETSTTPPASVVLDPAESIELVIQSS
jgi:hypothetical protein